MDESLNRLESLFVAALQKPANDRPAYLEQACADDPALRRRVEALLHAQGAAGDFLESPAPSPVVRVDEQSVGETPGTAIGSYKLLQQIGEGGMGTVWMAQQAEPVKRLVAIKLIKAGMDSRQVVARFEAERQALALMDHANIARVLEAGTTEAGRPYFVMDLVKGVPITRYCDEHHLPPRQRLELFLPVCQAVHHAHQKGIIHRDLKPSNVLVALYDGKPVPKVIDFGVAKAAGQVLTDKTLVTGFGNIVGTLEYMSPEQAEINQLDIDTRSDIYSLGVLLYELLTGTTPFTKKDLEKAGMLEMLRVIREQEPSKPSMKLSTAEGLPTLAANRGTEPAKLTKLVRGELDWIVMKALEKDRNRRYESANGFAMDVQRYLADESVLACPPSVGYRFRKFSRRNKGGLAVAALVLFFLMLIGSGVGWTIRDRLARQSRTGAQADLILGDVDRLEKEQKWPEALAAARRAEAAVAGGEADAGTIERVHQRLKDHEFIDRLEQIHMENAPAVGGKFNNPEADRAYAQAFREYGVDVEELAVEASIDRLKARQALVMPVAAALDDWVFFVAHGVPAPGSAGWQRLVAIARGIDPEPLRDRVRSAWGRPEETRDELRELVESIDVRAQHPVTLAILAHTLLDPKRGDAAKYADSAIRLLQEAQSVYPGDYWINFRLGVTLAFLRKDREGALRYCTAAVAIRPNSAGVHRFLGILWSAQGKLPEAAAAFRRAAELQPTVGSLHQRLGDTLRRQGKLPEAIAAFRKAIELTPDSAEFHNELAWLLATCSDAKFRDPSLAVAMAKKALELAPRNPVYSNTLGAASYRTGDWKGAIAALEKSMELRNGGDSLDWFFLAMAHWQLGQKDRAREWYDRAVQWMDANQPANRELRRFRAEAAALLGLEIRPTLQELNTGPTLLKPAAGASLDNGTVGGSKSRVWEFGWSEVPGATLYHLYVIAPMAKVPAINNPALTSSSFREENTGYVADQHRLGWHWKVRALVDGVWSDWSEERTFNVAPPDESKVPSPKK